MAVKQLKGGEYLIVNMPCESVFTPEDFSDEAEIGATIGFGAQVNIGEVFENFWLYPNLSYWKKSEEETVNGEKVESSLSEIGINAEGRYIFPSESNVNLFAGERVAGR